ncbi:hypothetical protein CPB83DRAFT_897996 [Crepidotus variabilis]|uniref:Uncharacterized protein n=1 Tax=Crepidotus variabilis TaxID=179855 RepID=A0A9P6JKN4_9AGAR|nr:hypothetical protein CPB83DRAFT_897996 [Crepidotus variabilis]
MGDKYIYYQIFNDNGALDVKTPVDASDSTTGRIHTNQITPPRNAGNLKRIIAKREGFPVDPNTALFFKTDDEAPAEDNQMIGFSSEAQFGGDKENPIGVVFQGDVNPSSKPSSSTNLSGGWSIEENVDGHPMFRGILVLVMRSATTFDGFCQQSNVYAGGSYMSFPISNGNIVDGNVEWTTGGAGWGNTNNVVKVAVTLSADGKSMTGSVAHVSGGTIGVPDATYRRL